MFRHVAIFTLGLAGGNFLYQCFAAHDWATATERSIFQAVALFGFWLTSLAAQRLTP